MDVDVEGEGQSAGLKGLLEEDDQALSLSAFETLEKEFQDVLATLAGDESLDEFRAEYEKVHRALVRSHVRSRRPNAIDATRVHRTRPGVVSFPISSDRDAPRRVGRHRRREQRRAGTHIGAGGRRLSVDSHLGLFI